MKFIFLIYIIGGIIGLFVLFVLFQKSKKGEIIIPNNLNLNNISTGIESSDIKILDDYNQGETILLDHIKTFCNKYKTLDEGIKTEDYKSIMQIYTDLNNGKYKKFKKGEVANILSTGITGECFNKMTFINIERFEEQVKRQDNTMQEEKFGYLNKYIEKHLINKFDELEKYFDKNLNKDNILEYTTTFDKEYNLFFNIFEARTELDNIKGVGAWYKGIMVEYELNDLLSKFLDKNIEKIGINKDELKKKIFNNYKLKDNFSLLQMVEGKYKDIYEKYELLGVIDNENFMSWNDINGIIEKETYIKNKNKKSEFTKDLKELVLYTFYVNYFIEEGDLFNIRRKELFFDYGTGIVNIERMSRKILSDVQVDINSEGGL